MWIVAYWKAVAERALSTAAQAGLAYLPVAGFSVIGFDWAAFAGIAGGGAVLSVLKSLVVNAVTGSGPSVADAEQLSPEPRRAE